jgi:hypothetical protein
MDTNTNDAPEAVAEPTALPAAEPPEPPSELAPAAPAPAPHPDPTPADIEELRLLSGQLTRMRGMLFGYSERFFERIRTWTLVSLGLLLLSNANIAREAVIGVPFLVPFAFLETGYLFYYTVFARRHAEYLERAINARFGRDILVAHRLEAAYFYQPDSAKIASISLRRPLGMMSVMTIVYTVGGVLLWIAGEGSLASLAGVLHVGFLNMELGGLLVPASWVWTVAIVLYLAWTFLARPDEKRLLAALDSAYRGPANSGPAN